MGSQICLTSSSNFSPARSPSLSSYYASLNILDANFYSFPRLRFSILLDPALKPPRVIYRTTSSFSKEIPPRNRCYRHTRYQSKSKLGQESGQIIQIFRLRPHAEYFPNYASKVSEEMRFWHALPEGWEHMQDEDFLKARRKAIARVIQYAFEKLSKTS